MNEDLYPTIATVLTGQFKVDPGLVSRDATLDQLGLDSLSLMEFVFAIEDTCAVRIPEDRLDPRQSGVTLAHLAALLREQMPRPAPSPVEG